MNIIPKPQYLKLKNSCSYFSNDFEILFDFDDERKEFLKDFIVDETDKFSSIKSKNKFTLALKIDEQPSEFYSLSIENNKCNITGADYASVFYGIVTFLQILESSKEENYKIRDLMLEDKPRFKYRGLHLDVSRHFFKISFIKRYIDLMAIYKYNTFHWHLTDDNGWRLEIKKYPKLTEIGAWRVDREDEPWRKRQPAKSGEKATYGGFYTQEEVKEVIEYANRRGIEIIPEIEMPGHSLEVLASYPELACFPGEFFPAPGSYWPNKDIFCAGKEEVFEFIENVLTEVTDLFPSKFIHIGGDEANKSNWKICPKCRQRIKDENLKDEFELQSYFILRIEKFLLSKGKTIIGWDEILEGGLAPQAVVMSWRGFEGGIKSAQMNHNVIMTPESYCYLDHYQSDPCTEKDAIGGYLPVKRVYSFDPVPQELTQEQRKYILGAQGNVWTEWIPDEKHCEYMILPRMIALAEVLWTNKDLLDWNDFRLRLDKEILKLTRLGFNVCPGSSKINFIPDFTEGYNVISLDSELSSPEIRFEFDEETGKNSQKYQNKSIKFDRETDLYAAIFKDGKKFGKDSVLKIIPNPSIKHNLELITEASYRYPGFGKEIIKSYFRADEDFKSPLWLGFQSDVRINLIPDSDLSSLEFVFLHKPGCMIYLPPEIIVKDKEDNRLKSQKFTPPEKETEVVQAKFDFNFKKNTKYELALKFRGNVTSGAEVILSWIFINQIICR
ncbi:MAG: beta-N-acetylhexosaminidase [Candidatus Cloacimonadota bacterium]|nr:MAG: beta-N-acetylhexosaminidase [Candidatus Cloacimonadota bacterium]